MKNKNKFIIGVLILEALVFVLLVVLGISCISSGKKTETDEIVYTATDFNTPRRLIVYNTNTDTIIANIEGCISVKNNDNKLTITCKSGDNYIQDIIYLTDDTLWILKENVDIDPIDFNIYINE